MPFSHESLDVYGVALDFIALADEVVEHLPRGRGHLADQLARASTSIALNLAEAELYHLRWKAEELFKLGKSVYFDQRQFHAKSALGVRQEILAPAIYIVIARFLLASAAKHVDARYP